MTWAELLSAIPFRLNRPTLPAEFVLEMTLERVTFLGPQVLTPAEVLNYDIVTQPGQSTYTLPSGTQNVRFVRVLYNGVWIPVTFADSLPALLESDPLQPPFTSLPVSLCRVYGNQLRLFPTPNQQYPVELTMMQTIPAPTEDDDDTNFWVTDGRVWLINATMAEICREYLDVSVPNSPRIATYDRNTTDALEKLMQNAHSMGTPSIIKQWL